MIYKDFQDKKLSLLGFGAMRLPTLADGQIDEPQVAQMVKFALENGVNYFDTAWPYHGGMSEIVIGKALKAYPRDSYYLATKYPGHQVSSSYDPAAIFEAQLKKCGVEYFDFYLLHNVYENSMPVYLDPQWNILGYFKEQKCLGRIKPLGFSSHGRVDNLREFLDAAGDDMEFCQIQLNWLDWTLQEAEKKVALLNERNIPVWVMEPVRGGRLCKLDAKAEETLKSLRPDAGIPEWSFRFLQGIPGVTMVLSGMSDMQQLQENVQTFAESKPLNEKESGALMTIAEGMKNAVPCTGCRYCTEHCPMGLDIPLMMETCSDLRFAPTTNSAMRLEWLADDKQPSACIGCGACAAMCPQKIEIPGVMRELAEMLKTIPKWLDICKEREEAAKKLAAKG